MTAYVVRQQGAQYQMIAHARQSQESQRSRIIGASMSRRETYSLRRSSTRYATFGCSRSVSTRWEVHFRSSPGLQLLADSNLQRRPRMKTLKRVQDRADFGQEVASRCAQLKSARERRNGEMVLSPGMPRDSRLDGEDEKSCSKRTWRMGRC